MHRYSRLTLGIDITDIVEKIEDSDTSRKNGQT